MSEVSRREDRVDRFDEGARRALTFAHAEALRLDHGYLGTEHLLLGMLADATSPPSRAIANLDLDLDRARVVVQSALGRGHEPVEGEIGLTPRSARVIERAAAIARAAGDGSIRPEHLLRGLFAEGEGIAAGILDAHGVTPAKVSAELHRLAGG